MILLEILKKMLNDTNSFKYNLLVILGDFSAGKISVMVVRRYHSKQGISIDAVTLSNNFQQLLSHSVHIQANSLFYIDFIFS